MRWLAEINLVCLLMFQFGRRYMVNLGRLHLLRRPTAVPQIAKQQIHPPDPLKTMTWQSVALSLILQRYTICSPWCTALLSIYNMQSVRQGVDLCVCVYPWRAICRSLVGRGFCVCECVCFPDWRFAWCYTVRALIIWQRCKWLIYHIQFTITYLMRFHVMTYCMSQLSWQPYWDNKMSAHCWISHVAAPALQALKPLHAHPAIS